ncbi:MAG: GDSL-type esterase/lipase family protein [Henriciella sp.]
MIDRTLFEPLDVRTFSRVERSPNTSQHASFKRQWPGSYLEAGFNGSRVFFEVGEGDVHIKISVDGQEIHSLIKPPIGVYEVSGLSNVDHVVRIDILNESQVAPTTFGPIFGQPMQTTDAWRERPVQLEFIGDSHTVGYANTSTDRSCTPDTIWRTTNTSLGIAGQLSEALNADYQVNAVSGRGVVRNYGGGTDPTIPELYNYVLFDQKSRAEKNKWEPDIVFIGIGTNDFSISLQADEHWSNRDALRNEYVRQYMTFIKRLRQRYSRAHIVIWIAADPASEQYIGSQTVVANLRSGGETRIDFVPITGLSMAACDWHPTTTDAAQIVAEFLALIDQNEILAVSEHSLSLDN